MVFIFAVVLSSLITTWYCIRHQSKVFIDFRANLGILCHTARYNFSHVSQTEYE